MDIARSGSPPPQFDLRAAARILDGTRLTPDGRAVMLWEVPTDHYRAQVQSAPGVMFESGMDGTVRGLTSDGKFTWEKKLPNVGAPAASRDGVLFVASKKKVVALDEGGAELWSVCPATSMSTACVAGPEGHCYVAGGGRLYALDGRTGKTLWKFEETPAWDDAPPLIGPDGTIYYCSGYDVLHAIDPADGREKWRYDAFEKKRRPMFSDFTTRLALTPTGAVCFGAADGKLHVLGADGVEQWSRELPAVPSRGTSPEVDHEGTIFVGAGSSVMAFGADGSTRWRQDIGEVNQLTALDSGVMVTVKGQGLQALDAAGRSRFAFPMDDDAGAKPHNGPHGEIFIGTERNLYALQPIDRFTAPAANEPAKAAPVVENHDGWIVIGGVRVPKRS